MSEDQPLLRGRSRQQDKTTPTTSEIERYGAAGHDVDDDDKNSKNLPPVPSLIMSAVLAVGGAEETKEATARSERPYEDAKRRVPNLRIDPAIDGADRSSPHDDDDDTAPATAGAADEEGLAYSYRSDAAFPPRVYNVPIKFDPPQPLPPPPLPPNQQQQQQQPLQWQVNWSTSFPSYSDDSSGLPPQPSLPQSCYTYYDPEPSERQRAIPGERQEPLSEEELRLRLMLWQEHAARWGGGAGSDEGDYDDVPAAAPYDSRTLPYEDSTALSLTDLDNAFSEAIHAAAAARGAATMGPGPYAAVPQHHQPLVHPLKRPSAMDESQRQLLYVSTGPAEVVAVPDPPPPLRSTRSAAGARRPPTHGHSPHHHHPQQQHRRVVSDTPGGGRSSRATNQELYRPQPQAQRHGQNHQPRNQPSSHRQQPQQQQQQPTNYGASQRLSPRKVQTRQPLPHHQYPYQNQHPQHPPNPRHERGNGGPPSTQPSSHVPQEALPLRSSHRSGSWSNLTLAYNTIHSSGGGGGQMRQETNAWRRGGTTSMPTTPTQIASRKEPSLGAFLARTATQPQHQMVVQRPHHRRTSSYASSTGANSVATDRSQVSYVTDIRQSEYFSHYAQSGKAQLNFPSSRVHLFMNQHDDYEVEEEEEDVAAHTMHHRGQQEQRYDRRSSARGESMGEATEHSLLLPASPESPPDQWTPESPDRKSSQPRRDRHKQPPRFRHKHHHHHRSPPSHELPVGKLYQVAIPNEAYENYHLAWEDDDLDVEVEDDLLFAMDGHAGGTMKCHCSCPQCKRAHGGHHVQLPPCYYAMAVPDDLYRRVLDEIVLSRQMPCRLFFCGQYEDVDRPSLGIALVLVLGLLVLMGAAAYALQS